MKTRNTVILLLLSAALLLTCRGRETAVTEYVDPFIGTGGHGHTYPGAAVPFGMVQLSPDTRLEGWDGCSGYHYSDSVLYGFSHTALSGTGVSDYGDILFMPGTGEALLDNGYGSGPEQGYSSRFDKSTEAASPGYYRVVLADYGILAELTASRRAGMHRYTFPANDSGYVLVDLKHRDTVLDSRLTVVSDHEIEGFRRSNAWATDQHVYFAARFSRPFENARLALDDRFLGSAGTSAGTNVKGVFSFRTQNKEEIVIQVGISAVSIEGARKNLDAEIHGLNFNTVRKRAAADWERELGRVRVKGGSKDDRTVFYTALYHAFLAPNTYMDADGRYRGMDNRIHTARDYEHYTVFSLWDTFRGAHPLFTILQQKRSGDFINTLLSQYEQGGLLPIWELAANYTGCMIGYHAVPVIADAYFKGIRSYDVEKAFEAMKKSADQDHLGLKEYREYGYIPGDMESESVSKTLEYAYDDWCIARMAKSLGKEEDYKRFIRRAQFYKNVYDPQTGFMRGRQNGTWHVPFDPAEVNFYFTEANAWQYSFFVPHDIKGLINLMGGEERFADRLDSLFSADSATTGRQQSDITGLIGQYAHGNEPSHHMAYLYNYAGQPWKTQELVRRIMRDLYTAEPDGLSGNEDCGQMSAWLVLSAMGFYPVTPGEPVYSLGSPLFRQIDLHLENGSVFSVKAKNNSPRNVYIQKAVLNGAEYSSSYLHHKDIMAGGTLVLTMGKHPQKLRGSYPGDRAVTSISDYPLVVSPWVSKGARTFYDSRTIELKSSDTAAVIYYTLDGTSPGTGSLRYDGPLTIYESLTLKAVAVKEGSAPSCPMTARFSRIPKKRSVTIRSAYDNQYTGGGDIALIDFIRGGDDFRNQLWQGYQGQDFEAVVDLGDVETVHTLAAGFLQDIRSWIWLPESVNFSVSLDGSSFVQLETVTHAVPLDAYGVITREFSLSMEPRQVRYVKVQAKNFGRVPDWHAGAGGESWLFIDEITIQ